MDEDINLKTFEKASYNQANLYQLRTHEIFSRINRLNANPKQYNELMEAYNFEIIFRDLCSVLSTIYSKLKSKERKQILIKKKKITTFLIHNPPFQYKNYISNNNQKRKLYLDRKNLIVLEGLLFSFRLSLERLMDIHEFGNPSKEDPTQAIVGN